MMSQKISFLSCKILGVGEFWFDDLKSVAKKATKEGFQRGKIP